MSTQWPRAQTQTPPMDGFTLRKTGDAPARIRIILYLNHQPSQYKLHPDLGESSSRSSFSFELTPNSQPALHEGGITNKRNPRSMELRQDQRSAGQS